jgi:protein SCO1/2
MRRAALLLGAIALCAMPAPAGADAQPVDAAAAEINPRYLLMDASGRAVTDEDFAGRFQLIAFGYTSCPDVCPSTLAAMAVILGRLGPFAARVQPLFISVDPQRDTGEVLRRYTENFDARIIGLTGTPEMLRRTADHFKVTYRINRAPGGEPGQYTVDHSVGMYLLGADGRFLARYAYTAAPFEIAEKIRARLEREAPGRR